MTVRDTVAAGKSIQNLIQVSRRFIYMHYVCHSPFHAYSRVKDQEAQVNDSTSANLFNFEVSMLVPLPKRR